VRQASSPLDIRKCVAVEKADGRNDDTTPVLAKLRPFQRRAGGIEPRTFERANALCGRHGKDLREQRPCSSSKSRARLRRQPRRIFRMFLCGTLPRSGKFACRSCAKTLIASPTTGRVAA
jgi:hypothetical protein